MYSCKLFILGDISSAIKVLIVLNLLQIYPTTEQASASSYSSAPSTPVSSPPPLAPTGWLTNHNTPHSPHYTQAVTVNNAQQNLHMVRVCIIEVYAKDWDTDNIRYLMHSILLWYLVDVLFVTFNLRDMFIVLCY